MSDSEEIEKTEEMDVGDKEDIEKNPETDKKEKDEAKKEDNEKPSDDESAKAAVLLKNMQNMMQQFQQMQESGVLSPAALMKIMGSTETNKDKASSSKRKDVEPEDEKDSKPLDDDFVVIDDADADEGEGRSGEGRRTHGDDDFEGEAATVEFEPGIWVWRRTYGAVDRALAINSPGVKAFNRPPAGVDHHPRRRDPKFKDNFEAMRNACHGYLTFQTKAMKAAVTWYNRTVKDPNTRLTVLNERRGLPPLPSRRPVSEFNLSQGPVMFSMSSPFVWADEVGFSLFGNQGPPPMLPKSVIRDWESRDQELVSLEFISMQMRRAAQLHAVCFEEMTKAISEVKEGDSAQDLVKKMQPAVTDLTDLNFFLCNRITALAGLATKASRRVVIDALGIPQQEVPDILYSQIGSPLFNKMDVQRLMSLSPKFDRFGNERGGGPDSSATSFLRERQRPLLERHPVSPTRGPTSSRYDDDYRGLGASGMDKKDLMNQLTRLIDVAQGLTHGHPRGGGGGHSPTRFRRRSRSRSPPIRGRRPDTRY